ncbi:hypothetical protein DL96DRAFT_1683868 [Flagelloscypha sp. PMI_526]|nr:hypothetical protein DL96DRAFT_1683868 [Flagelloscypha sp. PMI_526]
MGSSFLSSIGLVTLATNVLAGTSLRLNARNASSLAQSYNTFSALDTAYRPPGRGGDQCPPCFNCLLPAFTCANSGHCNDYNGQCDCPPGWGGIDCLIPQCDSLADGDRRRLREDGQQCECSEGWTGINCNVCKTDNACRGFPLVGQPSDSDDDGVEANMTCYKGGETIFNNFQMCDVTNVKIVDILGPERPPQATFSCDKSSGECNFQFWTAQEQSFYCSLDTCESMTTPGMEKNITAYSCENIFCKCIPGRFICGEDGSVDISEFLAEEIIGPAKFSCDSGVGCKFEEPGMNKLITDVFGDGYISLKCEGGECLHYSQVPGYVAPEKPDNTAMLALSGAAAGVVVLLTCLLLWYFGRASSAGPIQLPEDEAAKLMSDHVPATLSFESVTYTIPPSVTSSSGITGFGSDPLTVLDGISGIARPGQLTAIMGASGAGKSTLLDLLAQKRQRGIVSPASKVLINGRSIPPSSFKNILGYVDQEDTLMSTLTVYETVLYSALLRLPRDMSFAAKKFRTLETMNELGLGDIGSRRVGESGRRGISGGEKRRVSIACELVTSPSILFLDEPTSGLDAFNAHNVVSSLVSLAKDYNRTVIFTIHQPRSNIVSLFDQLILLTKGKVAYSGPMMDCQDYFKGIGFDCPEGFNIADYLIDLTVNAAMGTTDSSGRESVDTSPTDATTTHTPMPSSSSPRENDEEQGLLARTLQPTPSGVEETELRTRHGSRTGTFLKKQASAFLDAVSLRSSRGSTQQNESPELRRIVDSYKESNVAKSIKEEIERLEAGANGLHDQQLPDVAHETTLLRGRKRASWTTQFRILSGRAFKNLYRDPALLTAHYVSAIALAFICGFFYHNVTNDIPGFQNRLGIFFFSLALFGFSGLSSLGLISSERILFMRERANGYYSSFTYFSSKVLFDILPLRLVPPLMFGGIIYSLVGLVPSVAAFWKFILTLVLFNLATASIVLWLSIAFSTVGVASLVGTLIMLFNLLFTGLLINRESVPEGLRWLHEASFFHAAFEALAVNELRYLTLKQHKYGVDLDVPAATILSMFGLRAQSFWWPNISLLAIFFGVATIGSYLTLHFFVREKR